MTAWDWVLLVGTVALVVVGGWLAVWDMNRRAERTAAGRADWSDAELDALHGRTARKGEAA